MGLDMIRWYDYPVALLAADIMLTMAFSIPWVGFIVAYTMYEYGWSAYCEYRLGKENNLK